MEDQKQIILETVASLIREVVGDDMLEEEILLSTSFSDDLELESIEFVALAEKLRDKYGQRVDFVNWLSGMELDQILALRVGDLVEFVERCEQQSK